VCQALQLKVSKIRSFALFLWSTVASSLWLMVLFNNLLKQVLDQVSPKPKEVIRTTALRYPQKNRSNEFLPRTYISMSSFQCLYNSLSPWYNIH